MDASRLSARSCSAADRPHAGAATVLAAEWPLRATSPHPPPMQPSGGDSHEMSLRSDSRSAASECRTRRPTLTPLPPLAVDTGERVFASSEGVQAERFTAGELGGCGRPPPPGRHRPPPPPPRPSPPSDPLPLLPQLLRPLPSLPSPALLPVRDSSSLPLPLPSLPPPALLSAHDSSSLLLAISHGTLVGTGRDSVGGDFAVTAPPRRRPAAEAATATAGAVTPPTAANGRGTPPAAAADGDVISADAVSRRAAPDRRVVTRAEEGRTTSGIPAALASPPPTAPPPIPARLGELPGAIELRRNAKGGEEVGASAAARPRRSVGGGGRCGSDDGGMTMATEGNGVRAQVSARGEEGNGQWGWSEQGLHTGRSGRGGALQLQYLPVLYSPGPFRRSTRQA